MDNTMTKELCQAPAGDNRGRSYYREVQARTAAYIKRKNYLHVSVPLEWNQMLKQYVPAPKYKRSTYVRPKPEL